MLRQVGRFNGAYDTTPDMTRYDHIEFALDLYYKNLNI